MQDIVMEGLQTLFTTDPRPAAVTLRKTLKWIGWDAAPQNNEQGVELTYPFLVWELEETEGEDYTFDNNQDDYYENIPVSFTIASAKKSGKEVQDLMKLVKSLFRNQQMPLSTGRVLCATIDANSSKPTPDFDGQTAFTMITFQTGT